MKDFMKMGRETDRGHTSNTLLHSHKRKQSEDIILAFTEEQITLI